MAAALSDGPQASPTQNPNTFQRDPRRDHANRAASRRHGYRGEGVVFVPQKPCIVIEEHLTHVTMSSSSRVPLLVGSKGRKPARLPIAPRARPSNVDRAKRPAASDDPSNEPPAESERSQTATNTSTESHGPPERKVAPRVLPVSLPAPHDVPATSTPSRAAGSGISPGRSFSASRTNGIARAQIVTVGVARSPMLSASPARSPVERLSKITSKTTIPLFRPQEARTHASPILGPRATPIPAPHGPHTDAQEQSHQVLKRVTRKLDIKPHQSPRRLALNHHVRHAPPLPTTSPLMLSTPASAADVPAAPLEQKPKSKEAVPKKRGTKRRMPAESTQENPKETASYPARRSLRRKVKKDDSYMDSSDAQDDAANVEEDEEYEQEPDEEDDAEDEGDGLDLPEVANPPVYMPARERATLWAKKVLREQEEVDNGTLIPAALAKKERRKRSNSTSSVLSASTNATTVSSRKSKVAEELSKKEPSQMTMGELAMSIPKGRRMQRHEQEENADQVGSSNSLHRNRSLSVSSETPSFHGGAGSIVTPQVEIIDGKMVILESTVKINEHAHVQMPHDYTDDSVRRPRGARYLAANTTPGRRWSKEETKEFYYCLSQVGPNFSMMATLFPTRKRKELKSKFKYEEKNHPELIEIALKASAAPLDAEIVDVISQMADKETKKREEKRRKHAEATGELTGLHSPATVSSSAVATPPPDADDDDDVDLNDHDEFNEFYRERKNSFDFAG